MLRVLVPICSDVRYRLATTNILNTLVVRLWWSFAHVVFCENVSIRVAKTLSKPVSSVQPHHVTSSSQHQDKLISQHYKRFMDVF